MITQTRVKSGKPAQKIGYASVKPIMSDVNVLPEVVSSTRFSQPLPEGRLGVSMSGGYYTPYNASVPGGQQVYFYRSKLAGKSWYDTDDDIRKYLLFAGQQYIFSPGQQSIGLVDLRFSVYGVADSGELFDEVAAAQYGNDYRSGTVKKEFNAHLLGKDNFSFPYLPPGVPVIFPKLSNFYQESTFSDSLATRYTDAPDNKKSPFYASFLLHVGSAYDNVTHASDTRNNVGVGFKSAGVVAYEAVSGTNIYDAYHLVNSLENTVNAADLLKRYCSISVDTPIRYTYGDSATHSPGYFIFPQPKVTTFSYIGPGQFASHSPAFFWEAGKFPFATYYAGYGGTADVEARKSTPLSGALPYLTTAKSSFSFKYGLAPSDHIDFVLKSLFLCDGVTGQLSFKPLEDNLVVYQFAENAKYPVVGWAPPLGLGPYLTISAPVSHEVIDAKKLVSDWFQPIHASIPAKSSAVPGQSVASHFINNCNRQRFNIRLDLLALDSAMFGESGEFSVIITNPGIFLNVNDQVSGPFFSFCNSSLLESTPDNIFIDLYFFPHCQYYSDDIAEEVLSVVNTGVEPQYGNYMYYNQSSTVRKVKSYFDSFDKLGAYFVQKAQIDAGYLNAATAYAFDFYKDQASEDIIWSYADIHPWQLYPFYKIPTSNFLDFYDSSFEICIVSGHLTAEDIPDPYAVDFSSFTVLYSSKAISDKNIKQLSNTIEAKINSFIKDTNYSVIFPYYDPSNEGTLFSYSASLFNAPYLSLIPDNEDAGQFRFQSSPGYLINKINPFFNLIACSTDIFKQDLFLGNEQEDIDFTAKPQAIRHPFQLSWFPVPISPFDEPASFSDEVAFIKQFGNFYEFNCFFTGSGFYDSGTLDAFCVGVFGNNYSGHVRCYVECVDDPSISGFVAPGEKALFLGELDLVANSMFQAAYTVTGDFYKYAKTFSAGSKIRDENTITHFIEASNSPNYPAESGPASLLTVDGSGFYDLADVAANSYYYLATAAVSVDNFAIFAVPDNLNKVLTKVIDNRFFVARFRVYIDPVPGHILDPEPGAPFLPGYIESGALKADGLIDFRLEFCSPLFDSVDNDYKYLSVEDSPDKTQYDSIFRIYSGMMYPYYLKKSG